MFFQNTDIFIKLFSENLPYMILLIISIIGAISLFYFITQLSANQIAKINYKNIPFVKILYFVFGGLLAGVIYGLFDVSLKIFIDSDLYYLSADNIIIFELVIIIAFSLMSSFFTSVLSIFTLLGISAYNLINNTWWHNLNSHYENNINILIFLITSYLVTFISLVIYRTYLTITKRKKDKKNNILFSIIILSIIFVIYLISFNVVLVDAIYSFIFNYLMAILTFVFLMVIFKNIEKVIVDTFFLKRSIVYDDDIFVREEFASNIFLKFIKSNKISYGLLFKIIFNGTDIVGKKLGASKKTNLESEITNNFFNIIKVNKLFLKNGYNERLFFIPIDIEFNDNKKTIFKNKLFHELENTIKKVSKKYTINDKNFDISINIVGTLYGIHSCELDSLNKNIEKINLDNFLSNSKKNIFLYYGINEVEKDEWKNGAWFWQLRWAFL